MNQAQEILATVGAYRNQGMIRRSDVLRWELSVPFADHARLVAANPDLKSRDAATRTAAWKAFLASPESAPYRVRQGGARYVQGGQ